MSIFTSRPALRWGVPVAVFGLMIGGGAAARSLSASADSSLPLRTAAQLLVDLQTARTAAGSGTVLEQADLGLPALPGLGGQGSSSLSALTSGPHTMRVWFSGPDKARVALMGTLGESDIITNGHDVWRWDSQQNTATHSVLSGDKAAGRSGSGSTGTPPSFDPNRLPKTPQDAANLALGAIASSTTVTTSGSARVAGRAAYELALQPKDTASLIGRVTIALDSVQHVPLRVQIFPVKSDTPAFEVAFRQVSFARPDASQFTFSPPKGATVKEQDADTPDAAKPDAAQPDAAKPATGTQDRPTVVGAGWTSVVVAKLPADAMASATAPRHGGNGFDLNMLPKVSGTWGSGHLLTSKLVSVLITDDGRVLAGAVRPDRLYQAAGK
jgi:outer membrane lipoprotein-sorting protein